MGRPAHAVAGDRDDDVRVMRNPELLPAFAVGFATALAWLRTIVLTQWQCRSCGEKHLHCECKPRWVKILL
jgi:hypothetical protein